LFAAIAVRAPAGPINVGPIPITGSGTDECNGPENCFLAVSFQGSAADSVSFFAFADSGNQSYFGQIGFESV
jgi:hypothetical protein